jgi:hypothetical protein
LFNPIRSQGGQAGLPHHFLIGIPGAQGLRGKQTRQPSRRRWPPADSTNFAQSQQFTSRNELFARTAGLLE